MGLFLARPGPLFTRHVQADVGMSGCSLLSSFLVRQVSISDVDMKGLRLAFISVTLRNLTVGVGEGVLRS